MSVKSYKDVKFVSTDSEIIYLASASLSGLQIPDDAAFNSKTLEVHASFDGINFAPIFDNEGAKFSISLGQKRFIPLFLNDFSSAIFIKFIASADLAGKSINIGTTEAFR